MEVGGVQGQLQRPAQGAGGGRGGRAVDEGAGEGVEVALEQQVHERGCRLIGPHAAG